MRVWLFPTIAMLLVGSVGTLVAQRDHSAAPLTAQTVPVSPSVLATVITRSDKLEAVVLWRGEAGWFLAGSERAATYSEQNGEFAAAIRYGGVDLNLTVRTQPLTASLQGKTLSVVPGSNVLLIDRVGEPKGPQFVGSLSVPAGTPNPDVRQGSLAPFFRSSERLAHFLRCEIGTRDEIANQKIRELVCADLHFK